MNEAEYWAKCISVARTSFKNFKRVTISPEERLKACFDAAELFCHDTSPKHTEKTATSQEIKK